MTKKRVAVIGAGYWGKNLIRNFSELKCLAAICDEDKLLLKKYEAELSNVRCFCSYSDLMNAATDIDAFVIATPAVTHYEIVKQALLLGKDVFVEKPLALRITEAEDLERLAATNNRILMVDHILRYHPAVLKLKEFIDSGKLGKLRYIYSNRLNIGRLRREENILWSFAPHDISVILYLTDEEPSAVDALGEAYLQDHVYDVTMTHLHFPDRLSAHVFVSWLHPFKEQKLVVVGDTNMAVFDDVQPKEKLVLFPHRVDWVHRVPVASKGDREVIPLEEKEPLREACLHFIECVEKRTRPLTDAAEGVRVLRVLDQAQRCLDTRNSNAR